MPVPRSVPLEIDRYRLLKPIGRGGMAEVFHARLVRIGGFERDVAVKVLLPEYSSEPEFVEMLLDEARIAGALDHPCIVQVIDVGRQDDLFYLVMEHVDGSDLRTLLKRAPHRTLGLPAALYIVEEVLRGLGAVHTAVDGGGIPRRIVHRDVSPANVMVSKRGMVKLGDFGIAHASSRLTRTRNGAVKGKLKYMAPEQIASAPVDHRADLYAVGVMLCELLAGDAACEPKRPTPYGPVFAWSPRVSALLPPDVAQIAERALAEDPARRFADAVQFRQAVAGALNWRRPGYGADELARDLAALDPGFLDDLPTIASEAIELQTDLGNETIEQKVTEPHEVARPVAQPFPPTLPSFSFSRSLRPALSTQLMSWLSSRRLPKITRGTAAWAAGAAGAAVLVIAALFFGGASSAAQPGAKAIAAPVVTPLQPARPLTGTLAVEAPPGAQVLIGSTVYPAGDLELPPGQYRVTLRRRARARGVVRRVTIAAGTVTPIKL